MDKSNIIIIWYTLRLRKQDFPTISVGYDFDILIMNTSTDKHFNLGYRVESIQQQLSNTSDYFNAVVCIVIFPWPRVDCNQW